MAKKKELSIDIVMNQMIDGLECPIEKIIGGKKDITLQGDYMTFEVEPSHGADRAFGVGGEEGEPTFCVQIYQFNDL